MSVAPSRLGSSRVTRLAARHATTEEPKYAGSELWV
jgi:hypothetical protein